MHNKNINLILNGNLGKKMKRNKNYIRNVIICDDEDIQGFRSLWVFFEHNIQDKTLKKYLEEGKEISRSKEAIGRCENLDNNNIIKVYGKKVIVFS